MKTFNQFNESVRDAMKPKSSDDIKNSIDKLIIGYEFGNIRPYDIFMKCCENGYLDGVIKSLEKDIKNSIKKSNIDWGLSRACYHGHMNIIKYLIEEKNADIHNTNDYPLRVAVEDANDINIVKYLLDKGANIHVNNDELTKFKFRYRNKEMLDLLLNYL